MWCLISRSFACVEHRMYGYSAPSDDGNLSKSRQAYQEFEYLRKVRAHPEFRFFTLHWEICMEQLALTRWIYCLFTVCVSRNDRVWASHTTALATRRVSTTTTSELLPRRLLLVLFPLLLSIIPCVEVFEWSVYKLRWKWSYIILYTSTARFGLSVSCAEMFFEIPIKPRDWIGIQKKHGCLPIPYAPFVNIPYVENLGMLYT